MDPATFATAYTLSTSIGIRPFLTLAFASLAMHLGFLHPSPAFAYLGSGGATWLLAGLALIEFVGDKIPVVDHTLHVIHFATKPVAAALLVGSAVSGGGSPDVVTGLLMGVGALNALGVHAGVTALRGASTATTLGVANPFISLGEDIAVVFATMLAVFVPFVGALLAIALTMVIALIARHIYLEVRRSQSYGARSDSTSLVQTS
jgi:Domain of unknown function (DUF4126)